jgi:adenylate cyclase
LDLNKDSYLMVEVMHTQTKQRLAAILAADAVGFSRLMHDDEEATVATLDEFREVFRIAIEANAGRVIDMAGDSILAIFDSAFGAVNAANQAQSELARRNEALPTARQMKFRVGVNLGDILVKDDGTIYGDGVNIAARLQSMANPGGINVSGSVFDSVHTKLAGPFNFRGEHVLKNIATPVPIYSIGSDAPGELAVEASPRAESAHSTLPKVNVKPLVIISGGAELSELAAGLHQDIVSGLTKQTAIEVTSGEGSATEHTAADFQLEGNIRGAGERVRLAFNLLEVATGRQAWSERYDRTLSDVFELEDEISRNVASAVRLRIKARVFEKLRDTSNDRLSTPDLLSKAAGYLVSSYSHNEEIAEILALALNRMPEHSMARAMMVFCRHRQFEFSPEAIPESVIADMSEQSQRALALDGSSFFAHLMIALVQQDLHGNFAAALLHAESARSLNPAFSQATAMLGIAKIHLGETAAGIALLQQAITTAPEDPHRFRHFRELALGHFVAGDLPQAATTIDQLCHLAPGLLRNEFIAVPILWHGGRREEAKRRMTLLLTKFPALTFRSRRPTYMRDATAFDEGLAAAGLPA